MSITSPEGSTCAPADNKWIVGSLSYTKSGLVTVFFWLLLGGMTWVLKDRAGQPIVQVLLSNYGASNNFSSVLVGAIPSSIAIWILPFLGYFSDRYRSSWGRRIPFLAVVIPIVVISMLGLAASPWLGRQLDRALTLDASGSDSGVILCLAGFWTLFEFAFIVGTLILNSLANDVIPRCVMGRFFGAFRALGLLAGMGFNYYLFERVESDYASILLGIAVLAVIGLTLMCLKVREGTYPPPPDPRGAVEVVVEAKGYLRDCFGSSFYWLLFIGWTLGSTAWNPVNFYSVLFSTAIITPEHYGSLLTLTFAVSFVLAYPLGVLADRFHPLRLGILALALYSVATLWGGFCARTPLNFDITFVLHGVLSGAFMTAAGSFLQRLLPRLKFAQFASAAGVIGCLWNIFIVPLAGLILNSVHQDYRYIFLLSSAQSCAGMVAMIVLYRAFLSRGGDEHYVAPGEEMPEFTQE